MANPRCEALHQCGECGHVARCTINATGAKQLNGEGPLRYFCAAHDPDGPPSTDRDLGFITRPKRKGTADE